MIIGYFDYLIIGVLIILNIKFWHKEFSRKDGCVMGGILFGFILPFLSVGIELQIVGEWMDSFEVAYTILKIPTYWFIGIIQLMVTGIKLHLIKRKEQQKLI